MAEHTVTASSIAENEEEHERGALYVEKETGHHYMMARVSLTDYALIHIATGNRHADATSEDPFAGERGDFRRIPGNRKITIE